MANYDELKVWQRAMDLAEQVYTVTARFPNSEVFGLTAQVRRSAVSVPSNIAEGHGRETQRDFARFLAMARGSLSELETQLRLAARIGYLDEADTQSLGALSSEVAALLRGLQRRLQAPQ